MMVIMSEILGFRLALTPQPPVTIRPRSIETAKSGA